MARRMPGHAEPRPNQNDIGHDGSWHVILAIALLLITSFAVSGIVRAAPPPLPLEESPTPEPAVRSTITPTPTIPAPSVPAGSALPISKPPPRAAQAPVSDTPIVFLDPGHGGPDPGTFGTTLDGTLVMEKDITLAIALRTAKLLEDAGYTVVLSRTDDSLPGITPADLGPDGVSVTPEGLFRDLRYRVDRANASGALVLVSIHLNAFTDPSAEGTETYFDSSRPFAPWSDRLATLIQQEIVAALRASGLPTTDRGIYDETSLSAETLGTLPDYQHLVVLGPAIPDYLQASQMPGVVSEVLFLTNRASATAVSQPDVQDRIAAAYASAISQYLEETAAMR